MDLYIARFKNEVYAPKPDFKTKGSYPQRFERFFVEFCSIKRFEIIFDIYQMIDRNQYSLLVKKENSLPKWEGPWAPHSPYALTKENAVQMLRWWNVFKDKELERLVSGDKKEQAKNAYLRRTHACEDWLRKHNTKVIEPWWIEPLTERIWV